jgi:F-type H+-transporting ATPase subunit a
MKEGIDLFEYETWKPLETAFGFDHPFWSINKHTIVTTWIVLGILLALVLLFRLYIHRKNSTYRQMVLTIVDAFVELSTQTLGRMSFNHCAFITALFTFILFCNCASLIPWLEEPTQDLNTTLALGIISFLYIQASSIQVHGLGGYIKEYFTPFFIMFPLHVVGKLANIISISFRLFGNIFGGVVIMKIWSGFIEGSIALEFFNLLSGMYFLLVGFFVLFEGFLQAFVFSILTLTYLSIAIQGEEEL